MTGWAEGSKRRRLTPTAGGLALAAAGLAALAVGGSVLAQIEGPDRGIRPVQSNGDYLVSGIKVNVTGDTPEEARTAGWKLAQREGWARLWARMHNGQRSGLPDGTLDGIVSAIVVEEEQIGPRRYVARLGVLFDRARAGQILGVSGTVRRSAPLLLVPILYDGGTAIAFEQRNGWQRSWAQFRTSESRVDYVRPSGAGGESLLINAGQADRRNRVWWRAILDQFGAADVIVAAARLERQWPGGPVVGRFTARYGPDNRYLGSFSLRAANPESVPGMFDEAVRRMDQLFARALDEGRLRVDSSLIVEQPLELPVLEEAPPTASPTAAPTTAIGETAANTGFTAYAISVDTPDADAMEAALASIRSIPGVQSAAGAGVTLGGTSGIRVTFNGELSELRAGLFARGWLVQGGGGQLSISRAQ